jgi:hypothetical protein
MDEDRCDEKFKNQNLTGLTFLNNHRGVNPF